MKKLLTLCLLLGAFACKSDDDKLMVPKIEATDTAVDAKGGEGAVGYRLLNAAAGEKVEATADADWITDIAVGDNIIRFEAAENDTTESRQAGMTLSYRGAESLTITITQEASNADFTIKINSVSPYGCNVTYTPVNYDGDYLFLVVEKSTLDKYMGQDMEDWYAGDYNYIKSLADRNGVTIADLIPAAPQIFGRWGAAVTMDYSTLTIDTEYYAYCYGIDSEGNRLTDMCYASFTTAVVDPVDMTFEAEITQITDKGANIVVTPSLADENYFWVYISDFDFFSKADSDINKVMTLYIQTMKYEEKEYGIAIADILRRGTSQLSAEQLWSNTLYRIVAWGMDEKGTPTTMAVEAGQFTTLPSQSAEECTFEISCPEIKQMDILINVKPSNPETRYYIAPIDEDICSGYNDEQMAQRIINMETERFKQNFYGAGVDWSNFESVFSGEQSLWGRDDLYWTFKPDHNYRIFVFGVDAQGVRTTDVARFDQKTAPAEQSSITFTVETVETQWNTATFRITPSNDTEYWLPFLIYTEDLQYYRLANGSLDAKALMAEIDHYYDDSTKYYTHKGEWTGPMSWVSDTDYTMLVCGYAGTNSTQFYEYVFHSPEIPFGRSEADVTATYEMFDGAELIELDPQRWQGAEDDCIMYIRYTPNDKAAHWYGGVWNVVEMYETGVDFLLALLRNKEASHVDRATGMYRPWFGYTWSFSYVAEGEDGNFGQWHYEEFTPYRDGVMKNMSEPYDFWSKPAANSAILSVPKRAQEAAVRSAEAAMPRLHLAR